MAQNKFGSAGVSSQEIDLSGPVSAEPIGVPAGIVGTALKGPAFVPVTVGTVDDFYAKFGKTDGEKYGPLAVTEWLRNAQSVTYLRVLGVGTGLKRSTSGNTAGKVDSSGFVVGENLPDANTGFLSQNPYANAGGIPGRTYFLGCFMSESAGSTYLSDAGLQSAGSPAVPLVRGILMTASGVLLRLSSSYTGTNAAPTANLIATDANSYGSALGSVTLYAGSQAKQEFTMFLNGHKGTDAKYPNVFTASFDPTSPNYFANVLNQDPYKIAEAGHCLYSYWDVSPILAVVTGSGLILSGTGAGAKGGVEPSAFITTGTLARNVGDGYAPNFENFENRFSYAVSPWIISQKFGGKASNLFKFHSLDAGSGVSNKVKISIENIAFSSDSQDPYGTFDVLVRDWSDNDGQVRALESYRGLSLNPSSDRYIAKAIGDLNVYYDFDRVETAQKIVVDGNYVNKSNYVRVEVDSSVTDGEIDPTSLPIGFRGPAHLVTSGSAPLTSVTTGELLIPSAMKRAVQPPVPYRSSISDGAGNKKLANAALYWGVQFEQVPSLEAQNSTIVKNNSLQSYTKYFPDFMTSAQNVIEGGKIGVADSTELGILDADRFNNNGFTLENIQVVTASNAVADPQKWQSAVYVRNGNIVTNDVAKTRRVKIADFTQTNRRFLKFTLFLQGGFDGVNIMNRDEAELSNSAVKADMEDQTRGLTNGPNVRAYVKSLDVMKNKTDVDVQLLAIPGIRHSIVTDAGVDAVENRFDALYIMDIEEYDNLASAITSSVQLPSVTNTVTEFKNRAMNSSFAAAYFPDVVITDPNTKSNVVVPPSVAVLGALAKNDSIGHPWFAPAGFARGGLDTTLEAKVRLSKDNLDALYDANVNPLVAFPGSTPAGTQASGGVVIWGQKTLQSFASALDRVNVRRLLIDLRRQVREISNLIIFEPNRETTLKKFSNLVEPRLAKIQKQNGVERYKIQIDTSTTTQADVENNTIRGKIYVQPTKSIEFVSLSFEVTNAGRNG